MRKFTGWDFVRLLRLLRAANLSDEVARMSEVAQGSGLNVREVGARFILACAEKLGDPEAETALWDFLAGVTGESAENVAEADFFADTMPAVLSFFEDYFKQENVRDFFGSLAAAMRK